MRGGIKKEEWIPKPKMDGDDGPSVEQMYEIMERFFPSVPEPVETKCAKANKKKAIRKKNWTKTCRFKTKILHFVSKISI